MGIHINCTVRRDKILLYDKKKFEKYTMSYDWLKYFSYSTVFDSGSVNSFSPVSQVKHYFYLFFSLIKFYNFRIISYDFG